VVLGIVGFVNWNETNQLKIERFSWKSHIGIIIIGLMLSLILGKFMSLTNQQLPYLDAFVSIFAVIATLLSTKSMLENWIYWLIVNVLSILLFSAQDLQITTFLYFIYLFGSIFGYYNWKKMQTAQSNQVEV
jgi:nicotinamide mononucleotide transporter